MAPTKESKAVKVKEESPEQEPAVFTNTATTPAVENTNAGNTTGNASGRSNDVVMTVLDHIASNYGARFVQPGTAAAGPSSRSERIFTATLGRVPAASEARRPLAHSAPGNAVDAGTQTRVSRNPQTEQPDEDDELMFPNGEDIIRAPGAGGETAWNRPGGRGEWEFVPGTDISDASVGVPEPHKLVLIRRRPNNFGDQEFRLFPRYSTIDWNDRDHISMLNKYRDQVIKRTRNDVGKLALPWTQKEKDALYDIVKEQLEAGANSETLDWNLVATALSQAFLNETQRVGDPLAQRTTMINGKEVSHYKKARLLKEERRGPVERSAHNIRAMAYDYANILQLLHDHRPTGARERREDPMWARLKGAPRKSNKRTADGTVEEGSEEGEGGVVESPTKKKKKKASASKPKFTVPTDRHTKDPKDPKGPPPTSGAPFAGVIQPVA